MSRFEVYGNYVDSPAQEPYPFVEERVLPPVVRTFIHFNMREVSEVSSDRVCRCGTAEYDRQPDALLED